MLGLAMVQPPAFLLDGILELSDSHIRLTANPFATLPRNLMPGPLATFDQHGFLPLPQIFVVRREGERTKPGSFSLDPRSLGITS